MATNSNSKYKVFLKVIGIVIITNVILYVLLHCISWVETNELGVMVKNGQVEDKILQPGIVFHKPFTSEVHTISTTPKQHTFIFSESENGAITKDMQTVGSQIQVTWKYQESRVIEIVKKYPRTTLEHEIQSATTASFREIIGDYTMDELLGNEAKISPKLLETLKSKTSKYPVEILQMTVIGWILSDSYKRYLQENNIKYP